MLQGYWVKEELGKGAFGTVYMVRRQSDVSDEGHKYAMKELPISEAIPTTGATASENEINRAVDEICKEVQLLSTLKHPNIVRYYTSFVEDNTLYIIMELVEGVSLQDYLNSLIEKRQRLTEEQIWGIFTQLCLALTYLHKEKCVVHRDLTPGNIMLDISDPRAPVKITDFGLARQHSTKNSLLKSAVGTISYSCPEIVQHQRYGAKADVWSLGCILYQMATLSSPFAGGNLLAVAQNIVNGTYQPVEDRSPLLAGMVRRLLAVDPDLRPSMLQVSSLLAPIMMAEVERLDFRLKSMKEELASVKRAKTMETEELRKARMRDKLLIRRTIGGDSIELHGKATHSIPTPASNRSPTPPPLPRNPLLKSISSKAASLELGQQQGPSCRRRAVVMKDSLTRFEGKPISTRFVDSSSEGKRASLAGASVISNLVKLLQLGRFTANKFSTEEHFELVSRWTQHLFRTLHECGEEELMRTMNDFQDRSSAELPFETRDLKHLSRDAKNKASLNFSDLHHVIDALFCSRDLSKSLVNDHLFLLPSNSEGINEATNICESEYS